MYGIIFIHTLHLLKYFLGQGGIGKSTAMKHLSLIWTDGISEELEKFNFVFHLALKDVNKELSIEELIIKQHKGFVGNNVHPSEIKAIIEEQAEQKVLIILDGHDEYKRGNKDIDDALKKEILRNCWFIVTSRESKELVEIRQYMDAEAKITGFDGASVKEYVTKYLGNKDKCEELLRMAYSCDITWHEFDNTTHRYLGINYGILSIPILLHMICCLFLRKVSLPKLRTGIISAIVNRCVDWETIRNIGKKGRSKAVDTAIVKLGKLAMDGLQREYVQQSFDKVWNSLNIL